MCCCCCGAAARKTTGVEYPEYLADSWCDMDNNAGYNTAKCGWDGGDCCAWSCEAEEAKGNTKYGYACGEVGYACGDPKFANKVSPSSSYAVVGTGLRNVISEDSPYSTISGGAANTVYVIIVFICVAIIVCSSTGKFA